MRPFPPRMSGCFQDAHELPHGGGFRERKRIWARIEVPESDPKSPNRALLMVE